MVLLPKNKLTGTAKPDTAIRISCSTKRKLLCSLTKQSHNKINSHNRFDYISDTSSSVNLWRNSTARLSHRLKITTTNRKGVYRRRRLVRYFVRDRHQQDASVRYTLQTGLSLLIFFLFDITLHSAFSPRRRAPLLPNHLKNNRAKLLTPA